VLVIKGGYVLGAGIADVAVEDGAITAIGPGLTGTTVIDARGHVVAPGFVDTHRHVAQAPLRGIGADMTLADYLANVVGRLGFSSVEEARSSVLLGAAEAVDCGVTTVLDWSSVSSPAQIPVALEALAQSGIRAVFGHSNPDDEADVRKHADRSGLVTTALAPVGPDYRSIEDTARHIRLARELGLISSIHVGGGPHNATSHSVRRLHSAGLLGPDLHFVHGNMLDDDELRMIVDSGASLTVTPVVEPMMGHGSLAYGRFAAAGGAPALGVDVVINNRPDMFSEMQTALVLERPHGLVAARDLLRAATIDGARAIGLGDQVGSLEVGKRADIVLLDGLDHLFGAPAETIEGAVATSVGTENVRTVMVDGRVLKRDGVLIDHDLHELREATRAVTQRVLG
jgi:5-methylthioadenosine/S-adenosylhomocysteine deaminase